MIVLLAALIRVSSVWAEGFLAGVEDLPLMDGLTEYPDMGLVFDKPDGRIVESYAGGGLSPDVIRKFYRRSLVQLGWAPDGPNSTRFVRDGEALEIDFPTNDLRDKTLVRFRIAPRPGG